jgi:hypothetical protein
VQRKICQKWQIKFFAYFSGRTNYKHIPIDENQFGLQKIVLSKKENLPKMEKKSRKNVDLGV